MPALDRQLRQLLLFDVCCLLCQ